MELHEWTIVLILVLVEYTVTQPDIDKNKADSVLILVLVEYTVTIRRFRTSLLMRVLILVLVEYTVTKKNEKEFFRRAVLILVLVEYTVTNYEKFNYDEGRCLNPCFSGIYCDKINVTGDWDQWVS